MTVSLPPAARRIGAPDKASDVLRASRHPLDPFFRPQSVAVIGATEKAGSVGRTVLWNLISSPFGGTVCPINPKRPASWASRPIRASRRRASRSTWRSSSRRAESAPGLVRECGEAGVKGVIIISAGFKEIGPEGAALERRSWPRRARRGIRDHRPQLPRGHEPGRRPERHVRGRHGGAGLGRLHQPERARC